MVKGGGEFVVIWGLEEAGDFELEAVLKVGDFLFPFYDQAQGGRLDAAGGDGTGDLTTDDAGKIKADQHI